MIGYLGTPGALVALPYRGGLDTSSDRPVSFTRTLGGKRKAFMGARSRREWGVSVDLAGSKVTSGLVALAQSGGEVMWYPADATAGNLLSPQAVAFSPTPTNATDSGFVTLPDGTVAKAIVHSGTGPVTPGDSQGSYEMVPVTPGELVTVGVWGLNGSRFTGWWRAADSATQTSFASPVYSFTGWGWREYTMTVPAGAAFVSLTLSSGAQYARPSIAWGSVGRDRPGRGAPRVVVHGLSEALTVIANDDAYGSVDLTITEVG